MQQQIKLWTVLSLMARPDHSLIEKYCEHLNNAFTDLEEPGETVDVESKIHILL